LILTLLFREMQPLIDAGFVYIAKPPLYKIKKGSQERYIENDAELEEVLLADTYEKFEITDRDAKKVKLTEAKWQSYRRSMRRYEQLSAALRARHGEDMVRFLEESALLGDGIASSKDAIKLLSAKDAELGVLTTELESSDDGILLIRSVEKGSGLARTHRMPVELFDSAEYLGLLKLHAEIVKLTGNGPFIVRLGDREEIAQTFESLGLAVMSVAQKGVQLSRFKGLGEMNAEQLRQTTMDPATRTLQKVSIADAVAADEIFSMLMGDVVEPRRNFIEDNARDVVNLDV